MGYGSSKVLITALLLATASAHAADLKGLRNEINVLEQDLLRTKETHISAALQLKKIRKLLALQQKEIQLSKKRIVELGDNLKTLSTQKQELIENVDKQKISLRNNLRELSRLSEGEALDASWLQNLDKQNQKSYFLSKTLQKNLAKVAQLKKDVQAALALELKILEERNKLDYYVHELASESALLSANEDVYKQVLRTNRASRMEALEKMRSLRESETALQSVIDISPLDKPVDVSLAALKGKLPSPVEGPVVSGFGKSFNPKTNLLTFQKGVMLSARPADQVRAVAAGKVVFAGPLKNYGLIVILEHPGQYYTLYGQMGGVSVSNGVGVRPGDVLGRTTGEPLYFEIRNRNIAINPLQWLSNGSITLSKH